MNKTLLRLALLGVSFLPVLGACNAAREDGRNASRNANKAPVEHEAIVQCVLYDGMTKDSPQLVVIDPGMKVQVIDSVDVYFVKARVSKGEKIMTGYMYRTCFPKEW